ncbi:hypothetical protein TrLO_g12017 [Triparma laevis f. longispina]|uniref:Gfo/Idh/MocA-like oxidoreductase N-terminal domain-containing protein n=1 Tax=Triparma laevis f. longispina TaxID=1714387 RepID=A0A9W7KZA5_9STRA|nr:hypothetical protein TrLO_g12017 [Triparma laevis f. longispina]
MMLPPSPSPSLLVLLLSLLLLNPVSAGWGKNKDESFVNPYPLTSDDFLTIILTSSAVCVLSLVWMVVSGGGGGSRTVNVVLVGCGMPKKSMGWYHLTQLLSMPNVNVLAVVEPFFLGVCTDVPPQFSTFMEDLSKNKNIKFVKSMADLDDFPPLTMVLLAARTSDNPFLFEQALDKGAKCIYLEKPGAPTVKELERMKNLAISRTVPCRVFLGYNKNVTRYVKEAMEFSKTVESAHLEFVHNNAYKKEELTECFSRNSEGMLKNMAIHELALLVSFFDVRVDTVFKITVDKSKSEKLTLGGITDFSKVSFQVTTLAGASATVTADRCAGTVSFANVKKGGSEGKTVQAFACPSPEETAKVAAQKKADPEIMEYFLSQSDDYLTLKTNVVRAFGEGTDAGDVATIEVAIEALKLAEFATASLMRQL